MSLISSEDLELLIKNGLRQREADLSDKMCDLVPVVLLRLPSENPSAWLLASVDPDNHDSAFGFMSVAGGYFELGYVSIREIEGLRGFQGKSAYHDPMFKDADPLSLSEYVDTAGFTKQITLQFTETPDSEEIKKDLGW